MNGSARFVRVISHTKFYTNRQDKKEQCPPKQFLIRHLSEKWKQHPQQGIKQQDVTAPDEHQVQQTEQHQHPHTTVENTKSVYPLSFRIADNDGEADAEQQREQRVELAINKDVQQITGYLVLYRRRHGCRSFRRQECIKGEFREICHTDTQQSKTAQGIKNDEAF